MMYSLSQIKKHFVYPRNPHFPCRHWRFPGLGVRQRDAFAVTDKYIRAIL